MRVFLTNASGLIGSRLRTVLRDRGHEVVGGSRRALGGADWMAFDFIEMISAEDWLPLLDGVDAIVNCVGVLRDSRHQSMEVIHHEAPAALFSAAEAAGIRRVIQVSALGVEPDSEQPLLYLASKGRAEQALRQSSLDWSVFRPSMVFGDGGAGSEMFLKSARFPLHALPIGDGVALQPVHVHDLAEAIAIALESGQGVGQTIAAVGSEVVSYREMLASYRRQLGHGAALAIPLPATLMSLVAALAEWVPSSPLTRDNLAMLRAGSCADSEPFSRLLGRQPLGVSQFVAVA
ncbi:NAD(P)H-binding protein [Gammaproteobacteria bacterium]|nr:NAD(P)H-binding protein [Gammaproteobacteria bacterium]